jgi:primosomal protein N' (replication factor Y) (superfamily II helicase)
MESPHLSGPVAVCVNRPVLSLDRPFTYSLSVELGAGLGSLVSVPFHGRLIRGYVLGATDDVPARVLPVRRSLSPVRFFDASMLELCCFLSERYVAPLAAVLARIHPPRVASEEGQSTGPGQAGQGVAASSSRQVRVLGRYRGGQELLNLLRGGSGAFVLRPAPREEITAAVEAVGACLAAGRTAVVLVPEAEPLPATASAIREAFGDTVALFLGGDRRERYRAWLRIAGGRFRCVVGTRPAVFAPLRDLGLLWVSRESHPGHREERSPYYHVRDVALARGGLVGAVCVLEGLCPSAEAVSVGALEVSPRVRSWPPVEVVRPGPEGRAPRLISALRRARRAFLYEPLPGAGVARLCRACGEPAGCARCGGLLRLAEGRVACAVCDADGECASCGSREFAVVRGGAERVEQWARGVSPVPVHRVGAAVPAWSSGGEGVAVGGPEAVRDLVPPGLDLVGILDADAAARRPGLGAAERSLAVWMEAAAWAMPGGRVVVQASRPNDPAVQALVGGNPARFHRWQLPRRSQAGFPVGFPVFRVAGPGGLIGELERLAPLTLLASSVEDETVCLVTVRPEGVATFGRAVRDLAERGVITRVEAEPHL